MLSFKNLFVGLQYYRMHYCHKRGATPNPFPSIKPEGSTEFRNVWSQGRESRARIQTFIKSEPTSHGGWFDQEGSVFGCQHPRVPTNPWNKLGLPTDVYSLGGRRNNQSRPKGDHEIYGACGTVTSRTSEDDGLSRLCGIQEVMMQIFERGAHRNGDATAIKWSRAASAKPQGATRVPSRTSEAPCQKSRVPSGTSAYHRVPPRTTRVPPRLRILDEGTRDGRVHRVPPRTSGYLRVPSGTGVRFC